MAMTEAQKKANIKYREKAIKRIPLDVQKEKYEEIKSASSRAGQTVNGYIKQVIDERMQRADTPASSSAEKDGEYHA